MLLQSHDRYMFPNRIRIHSLVGLLIRAWEIYTELFDLNYLRLSYIYSI